MSAALILAVVELRTPRVAASVGVHVLAKSESKPRSASATPSTAVRETFITSLALSLSGALPVHIVLLSTPFFRPEALSS
jgi:hypothetical protein